MKPSVIPSRKVRNSELDGEYIPHYYLCKWNRHHINLLFDSIHINAMEPIDQVNDTRNRTLLETLYIQKDFTNMFKCMGQDGATSEQPRTAIQEVSCFHIIIFIGVCCELPRVGRVSIIYWLRSTKSPSLILGK